MCIFLFIDSEFFFIFHFHFISILLILCQLRLFEVDIKPGSSLVTSLTKCGTIMANMGRSTEHLVRHMGEFSLFVPFVGVFIFIIILLVCMCKGKKSKATSDIESKVLAGSKLKLLQTH